MGVEFVVYQADVLRAPTHPLPYILNVNAGPGRDCHVSTGGDPAHWFLLDVAMARQSSIPLRGPTMRDLIAEPSATEVARAIRDALAWSAAHDASSPDAVLNACRSWCWIDTRRWTSKSAAAQWALVQATEPDDATLIAEALEARRTRRARLDEGRVAGFLAWMGRRAVRDATRSR